MDLLAETEGALQAVVEALQAELSATVAGRDSLRALDTPGLLKRAAERAAFNVRLAQLSGAAERRIGELCRERGAEGLTVADLTKAAPPDGARVGQTLSEVKRQARALADVDAVDRSIASRGVALIEAFAQHLPMRAAVYERSGAAARPRATATTSTTA